MRRSIQNLLNVLLLKPIALGGGVLLLALTLGCGSKDTTPVANNTAPISSVPTQNYACPVGQMLNAYNQCVSNVNQCPPNQSLNQYGQCAYATACGTNQYRDQNGNCVTGGGLTCSGTSLPTQYGCLNQYGCPSGSAYYQPQAGQQGMCIQLGCPSGQTFARINNQNLCLVQGPCQAGLVFYNNQCYSVGGGNGFGLNFNAGFCIGANCR